MMLALFLFIYFFIKWTNDVKKYRIQIFSYKFLKILIDIKKFRNKRNIPSQQRPWHSECGNCNTKVAISTKRIPKLANTIYLITLPLLHCMLAFGFKVSTTLRILLFSLAHVFTLGGWNSEMTVQILSLLTVLNWMTFGSPPPANTLNSEQHSICYTIYFVTNNQSNELHSE